VAAAAKTLNPLALGAAVLSGMTVARIVVPHGARRAWRGIFAWLPHGGS